MSKESAIKEIDQILGQLSECMEAAAAIREGIVAEDSTKIRTALETLNDHTDSYWHKLVIGPSLGEIPEYAEELEDVDAEGARADERFDRERDRAAIDAERI